MGLRLLGAVGALALGAALATPATAQTAGPCFVSAPIDDWGAHDVGDALGASAPGARGAFRLCGTGGGYGPDDAVHVVAQDVTGDFALTARAGRPSRRGGRGRPRGPHRRAGARRAPLPPDRSPRRR